MPAASKKAASPVRQSLKGGFWVPTEYGIAAMKAVDAAQRPPEPKPEPKPDPLQNMPDWPMAMTGTLDLAVNYRNRLATLRRNRALLANPANHDLFFIVTPLAEQARLRIVNAILDGIAQEEEDLLRDLQTMGVFENADAAGKAFEPWADEIRSAAKEGREAAEASLRDQIAALGEKIAAMEQESKTARKAARSATARKAAAARWSKRKQPAKRR